jgi:hypothetical protein
MDERRHPRVQKEEPRERRVNGKDRERGRETRVRKREVQPGNTPGRQERPRRRDSLLRRTGFQRDGLSNGCAQTVHPVFCHGSATRRPASGRPAGAHARGPALG